VWIRKSEIADLSADVKRLINGKDIDIRDNSEGSLQILKNDIHTLVSKQREEVAALLKERDVLKATLADISHQLNTPLTSMLIMTDLLESAPPEKRAEFIESIQSSLVRTQWLVAALLKMAQLESGTVELNPREVDSATLIETAMQPLAVQLELRGQEIEVTGQETVVCDVKWTAEALGNVVKNASEHSPEGSMIRIEVGRNPISTWVKVADQGAGITRSQIAKLFVRFQGSTNGNGFGIGLPLAQSIMRSQGGEIEVDGGGKGQGATFTLKFYDPQVK